MVVSLSPTRIHQLWQAQFSGHTQIWKLYFPSGGERAVGNGCQSAHLKSAFPSLEFSSFELFASTTLQII